MAFIPAPEEKIAQGDGAFVGVLVTQRDVGEERIRYTFLVEWALKGPIKRRMDVESSLNPGICGLGRLHVGERIGMTAYRYEGQWGADMSDDFDADELLAAAGDSAKHLGPIGLLERIQIRARTIGWSTVIIAVLVFSFVFLITLDVRARARHREGLQQPAP